MNRVLLGAPARISRDALIEWSAFAVNIVGAAILSVHIAISGWGFAIYLVANALWAWFAWRYRHPGLLTQQVVFALLNIVAITRWL